MDTAICDLTCLKFIRLVSFQKYTSEKCTVFPADLSTLTTFIANALDYKSYKAEAAIVNFYHLDSTLGGHTDHSEPNCEAPLFSIR